MPMVKAGDNNIYNNLMFTANRPSKNLHISHEFYNSFNASHINELKKCRAIFFMFLFADIFTVISVAVAKG